jgi:hypothetical protein
MQSNRLLHLTAWRASLAAVCAGLVLGACTTLGTGSGSETADNSPVSFNWSSKDGGVSGTMSASLPGDRVYSGPYLEITSTTDTPELAPMWEGWDPYWGDWPDAMQMPTTTYSGKVVANLEGPGNTHMRCRFDLNDPMSGMKGGGQGKCQATGGPTIDAVFPHIARSAL